MSNNIIYLRRDLNNDEAEKLMSEPVLAVDTELSGIDVEKDRLWLVQIKGAGPEIFLVQIRDELQYPNLKRVLQNPKSVKIFHYARMDVLMIYKYLGVWAMPVFCTKIATLLDRPNKGHALHNVLKEIFKIQMEKQECLSDWSLDLNKDQQEYAAQDVLHLHDLKRVLEDGLRDKNRLGLALDCFAFLKTRILLDLDWGLRDIFAYNPKHGDGFSIRGT
ncbi:MAG: ribonuclease D [Alphaproteobacteria bacterium]|nr:ribonuclease D [Alphaproteobacteria bacterium]